MFIKTSKISALISMGFTNSIAALSKNKKIALQNELKRTNLKNAMYLNIVVVFITIIMLGIDAIVYLDSSKELFPSHDILLAIHIITIPLLSLFSYIIYYFNFKPGTSTLKHYSSIMLSHFILYYIVASSYSYLEIIDFGIAITLIILLLIFAILFKVSFKLILLFTAIFITIYYSILYKSGITSQENPLVYVNGIITPFIYILLATVTGKQIEQRFINEILLKIRNKEILSKNDLLYKKRNKIELQNSLLIESNEKLSRFAHMAAHDLKGPLRTTQNLLAILYSKYNQTFDEEDKPLIEHLMKSSKNLGNLVNNLLLFSSLTQELPKTELVDIKEVIINVKNSLQSSIDTNQSQLIYSTELYNLKANKDLIYQLFLNLINNSIKFSQESNNKKIIIDCKKLDDKFIQYSIQDFGLGIKDDQQSKIFDMLFKGHSNNNISGTGIGLSICKKIVEFYQGEIWVNSKLGEGTTFYFTLAIDN